MRLRAASRLSLALWIATAQSSALRVDWNAIMNPSP